MYQLLILGNPADGLRPVRLTLPVDAPARLRVEVEGGAAAPDLWTPIELRRNGALLFSGRVTRRTIRSDGPAELDAVDAFGLAGRITATDARGRPRAAYNVAADDRDHLSAAPAAAAEILADLLTRHRGELADLGAAPADGSPAFRASDLAGMPPARPRIRAVNAALPTVLRRVASAAGRRVRFDPAARQWRFPDPAAAVPIPVAPQSVWLSEHADPGFAAAEFFADGPDPGGRLQWLRTTDGGLRPDWDAAAQAGWTAELSRRPDPADPALGEAPHPYAGVHRRFRIGERRFPDGAAEVRLWWRPDGSSRWRPAAMRFDRRLGVVEADAALIAGGDPDVPGDAAPAQVALSFEVSDAPAAPLLRVPAEGFSGAAYRRLALRTVARRWVDGPRADTLATWAPALSAAADRLTDLRVAGEAVLPDPAGDWPLPGGRVALPTGVSAGVARVTADFRAGVSLRLRLTGPTAAAAAPEPGALVLTATGGTGGTGGGTTPGGKAGSDG